MRTSSNDPDSGRERAIQEGEYAFPYHHVPQLTGRGLTQTFVWSWGLEYMGGLACVMKVLEGMSFKSLIDVGCGDGRFLLELSRTLPAVRLVGVDTSSRAIGFARAFGPNLDFRCLDIVSEPVDERFEIATLIEVLEHVHPSGIRPFLRSVASRLSEAGHLIVTVPHTNARLTAKHFQHFDSRSLRTLLEEHFRDVRIVPFDQSTLLLKVLGRICGGSSLVVNLPALLAFRWQYYQSRCLYRADEGNCRRVCAICTGTRHETSAR
jgi:SAM-dependent methyltransferase